MTEPLPDRVCSTCALPLNVFRPLDRPHDVRWQHARPADHPPRPVPRDQVDEVTQICDFCSATDVAWVYQTATELDHTLAQPTFTGRDERRQIARYWQIVRPEQGAPIDQQRHVYSPGWTACEPCAELIELRDMQRLITRVRRLHPDTVGAQPRSRLRDLYQPFFHSITGRTSLAVDSGTADRHSPDRAAHEPDKSTKE
jgi:hypothetical protein